MLIDLGVVYQALTKMAEHKLGMEVSELLQQRIPEARKQLRDSHKNLHDLATYCERNYIDTGQSTQALEETKRYAAQSLASVAYQVNMLATGMLELLDKQMQHLGEMDANISHISQVHAELAVDSCNVDTQCASFQGRVVCTIVVISTHYSVHVFTKKIGLTLSGTEYDSV